MHSGEDVGKGYPNTLMMGMLASTTIMEDCIGSAHRPENKCILCTYVPYDPAI